MNRQSIGGNRQSIQWFTGTRQYVGVGIRFKLTIQLGFRCSKKSVFQELITDRFARKTKTDVFGFGFFSSVFGFKPKFMFLPSQSHLSSSPSPNESAEANQENLLAYAICSASML
jgi:hypothetical protein